MTIDILPILTRSTRQRLEDLMTATFSPALSIRLDQAIVMEEDALALPAAFRDENGGHDDERT